MFCLGATPHIAQELLLALQSGIIPDGLGFDQMGFQRLNPGWPHSRPHQSTIISTPLYSTVFFFSSLHGAKIDHMQGKLPFTISLAPKSQNKVFHVIKISFHVP